KTQYGIVEVDTVRAIAGLPWEDLTPSGDEYLLADIKLLAPVVPPDIFAIGLNYRAHAAEGGFELPAAPVVFIKASSSVIGPGDSIILPAMLPNEVDYEAELAIVIGRTCRRVSEDEALDYVFGYTCGNDVSARDAQRRLDKQWARAKSFDTFCPLGPWIETDLDPQNVDVQLILNGQTMQSSNTEDMIFSCRKLVSYLSQIATLKPGTVIMTGTPSGVGVARSPELFLKPGDKVEVRLSGIGSLVNPVVREI
ncbi:MAG TPA: fumarylacetoacetate hydrolase family protein, partial [Armatimonadota bacterium]